MGFYWRGRGRKGKNNVEEEEAADLRMERNLAGSETTSTGEQHTTTDLAEERDVVHSRGQ